MERFLVSIKLEEIFYTSVSSYFLYETLNLKLRKRWSLVIIQSQLVQVSLSFFGSLSVFVGKKREKCETWFFILMFFEFYSLCFNSVAFVHLICKPPEAALPLTPVQNPSAAGVVSVASSPARAASEAGWGSCQKLPGKLTRIEVGGFPFFVKFSSLILGEKWSKLTNLKTGLVQPPTRYYCNSVWKRLF